MENVKIGVDIKPIETVKDNGSHSPFRISKRPHLYKLKNDSLNLVLF
jgi:hypothetical protein